MKVITGNIWDYAASRAILIPTNGYVNKEGNAIMGAGLALQASKKFTELPKFLGTALSRGKINIPFHFGWMSSEDENIPYWITSFPVKHNWRDKADLALIEDSAKQIVESFNYLYRTFSYAGEIYLPKVGCGNGKLDWCDVEPVLDKYFDERFVVVDVV